MKNPLPSGRGAFKTREAVMAALVARTHPSFSASARPLATAAAIAATPGVSARDGSRVSLMRCSVSPSIANSSSQHAISPLVHRVPAPPIV
ncbi:hypothetical protein ACFQ0G_46045 [Streptomyces chiangmaiensis]